MNIKGLLVGDQAAAGLLVPFTAEAKALGIDLVGDARPGTTIADWIGGGWLAQDIAKNAPDAVFIALGSNDSTTADIASGAKALAAQAAIRPGSDKLFPETVAWIAPQGHGDMQSSLRDAMASAGSGFIPTDTAYPNTADGYRAWAKDLASRAVYEEPGMPTWKKITIGGLALVAIGAFAYTSRELYRGQKYGWK